MQIKIQKQKQKLIIDKPSNQQINKSTHQPYTNSKANSKIVY
jgi:hypothetical protein